MNWKKLIVLFALLAVAVWVVLYYMKSVVSPPQQLKFSNQHQASLHRDAARMAAQGLEEATADSLFSSTLHAASLFQAEGFIAPEEADEIVRLLAQGYVPYFVQTYRKTFANSVWSQRQLSFLRQRAKTLAGLKTQDDNTPMLSHELLQQVDSANLVLDKYDMAWKLCGNSRFETLPRAEATIKQCRELASTSPLSNCKALVDRLYSMREVLGKAHFNNVKSQVDKLDAYRYYDREFYMNTLVKRVYDAIKEYKQHADRVYGSSYSTQQLENRARDCYNMANDYYNSL